jgi:hypothetical protein
MHNASPMIADRGPGGMPGGVVLGFVGAAALAAAVLANGYGPVAAFLVYSLGGAAILLATTLGRAALPPLRPALLRRRPAPPVASTFA